MHIKGEKMKVQAIKTYTPSVNNTNKLNNNNKHVSFGFSEDYGDDSFLYDSDHKSGNLFEYLYCLVMFPIVCIQEYIDSRREPKYTDDEDDDFEIRPNSSIDNDDDIFDDLY